jgi:hypothetical protein
MIPWEVILLHKQSIFVLYIDYKAMRAVLDILIVTLKPIHNAVAVIYSAQRQGYLMAKHQDRSLFPDSELAYHDQKV